MAYRISASLVLALVASSCFSPKFEDNQIQCGENGLCPPGFTCVDNVCRTESGDVIDAATQIDAPVSSDGGDTVAPAAPSLTTLVPGSPANDNTPFIVGSAEDGSTVRIFTDPGCATQVAVALAGQLVSPGIAVSVADNTTTTFHGTATDAAGNASPCTSSALVYVEDSQPPPMAVIMQTLPGSPSRSTAPTVQGQGEIGATVSLYGNADCSGSPLGTATVNALGEFAVDVTVTANQVTPFSAISRDAADNSSGCSGQIGSYEHDASAVSPPAFQVAVPPSPSSGSTTVELQGVAEPLSTVTVYTEPTCNSTPTATGTADATGAFAITVTVPANTTTTYYGRAEDPDGTDSACSQVGYVYVHDAVVPAAPVVNGSSPPSPSNSTTPSITGTAEALATVTLYTTSDCSGTAAASAAATEGGTFAVPVTVTGSTTFHGIATDLAGNNSPCSASSFSYVLDATAPAAPSITLTIPASPSTTNTTPVVVGSAETGTTVRIYRLADCSGTEAGSGPASGGAFGIGINVPSNSVNDLAATATDSAGNVSTCSAAVVYIHDSLPPNAPVITSTTPPSPSSSNTPTINGDAEAGATVRLYTDAGCSSAIGAPATATAGGTFSVAISVGSDTTTSLYGRATDAAGNGSACQLAGSYVEDSTAPATPVLNSLPPSQSSTLPTLTGTAEAGASVAVFASADCSGTAAATGTATAGGTFSIAATVPANSSTPFSVRATDPAGNPSSCSNSFVYIHDNQAPAPPTGLVSVPASPSQSATPDIAGNGEANSLIRLFTNNTCTSAVAGTATAAGNGTFSVAITVGAESTTTFYATASDAAGNNSTCSASFVTYTHDTVAPAPPTGLATSPLSPSSSNTPNVTGAAAAGSNVRLYTTADCTGTVAASGTASGAGTFSIAVSVAANTTISYRATATDAAGNVSACSASEVTYVEDSTAPTPPVIQSSTPASPANNNGPNLAGTAEANSTVRVYTSATCTTGLVGTTTADVGGAFSQLATVVDNTTNTYYASATDSAGNTSTCSSSFVYVEDSAAPATPFNLTTNPLSPRNNNTPAIQGNAETGSTVSIYTVAGCGGAVLGSGVAAAGAFSITVTVASNSTSNLYARASDAAGNQSSCSSAVSYTEDSTAPALPVITSTTPASPSGNANPVVNGTAEAGTTVRIFSGACATQLASGVATAGGTFAIATPVTANAATTLRATATDAATNASGCSASSLTYVHDSTAPGAPSGLGIAPASPANENTPSVTGNAETGATVNIYRDAGCSVFAATGSTGAGTTFSIPVSVTDNTANVFYARATDAAGNNSSCSSSFVNYVEDSASPSAPSGLGTSPVSPSNVSSPSVTGAAESGATVAIYTTADCSGAPTATGTAAAGSFAIAVSVANNSTSTFRARATDAAGNASGCSASSVTYVEDSTAPATPTGLATNPASPSNNNSPLVTGTTEANATVRIYSDASCTTLRSTGAANGAGTFSIATAVTADTTTTFYARATDAAGNDSACSASSVTYVEDSTAPGEPGALAVVPASPANDEAPVVTGTAPAGTTVRIYSDAGCSTLKGTGTATAGGTFSIATTVVANSSTTFRATASDSAGNSSACSTSNVTYVEDSNAPSQPTGLSTNPVSPSSNNSPMVSGSAEANSTIRIYSDAGCTSLAQTGVAGVGGTFSIAVTVAADSSTTFRATATDLAGNTSTCSTSNVSYVEDSTAPAVPTFTNTAPVSPSSNNNPVVNGNAESGATVRIYTTAGCSTQVGTGTAMLGTFSISVTAVANNTSTTYYANATDGANNTSACTAVGITYVEDSAAPTAPNTLSTAPTSPANNNTPSINGSTEAGAQVRAYTDAACSNQAGSMVVAGGGGSFSIPVTVTDNTMTTFYLVATDAAGNASACNAVGSSITYEEDSNATPPPNLTSTTPASPSSSDSTPDINGTTGNGALGSGDTIRLYSNPACTGAPIATTTADGSGNFTFAAVGVTANTTTTFYATATEVNPSACSSGITYIHDSNSPGLPTGLAVLPTSPANNNAPTVSGSAEAGSTVTLWSNAGCTLPAGGLGTGVATGGAFAIAVTPALGDNTTTTFYARATDAANNSSGCSTSNVSYTEDSTAPALPTVTSSNPVSPSNSDTTPDISGAAETGSTVRLYTQAGCAGAVAGSAVAVAGTYTVLGVSVAANSSTTFRATATDAAGNVSGCSTVTLTYVHDNTVPAAATGLTSSPPGPANDNNPEISGTAEAGATVSLYTNSMCSGGALASGPAATFNAGGLTIAVADNSSTSLWARVTDAANNSSACSSSTVTYVEDSAAPATPVFTGSTPSSPSSTVTTPTINGTAESGSTVRLYSQAACAGAIIATGTATGGNFAIGVTVTANTSTTYYARAVDAANNVGTCTAAGLTYTHDNTQPATPTGLALSPPGPANNNSPSLTGNAEANSTVRVYTDAGCTTLATTGTASAGGTFAITLSVADNTNTSFRTTSTDSAGNVSGCSAAVSYVEDSAAPGLASVVSTSPVSPSNLDPTPDVLGTAEANALVAIYTTSDCTGTSVGSATANGLGNFTVTVSSSSNSTRTFRAKVIDAAGNVSGCSTTSVTYTHDDLQPSAPAALATTPPSPSNVSSITLAGTAEASATIRIYTQANCAGGFTTTTATGLGAWSLASISVTANATTTFSATAVDAAGNVSACSANLAYLHDNVSPATPTVLSFTPSSPANNNAPVVAGAAENGATVRLYTDATCMGAVAATTTAGASGYSVAVAVGDNSSTAFRAKATDPAGNVSGCSAALTYLEDSSNPTAPTGLATTPTSPSNVNTFALTGSAENGATVRIWLNGTCAGAHDYSTASTGTFSQNITVAANTTTTMSARAVDAAGNLSPCSSSISYLEDSVPPTNPFGLAVFPASPGNVDSISLEAYSDPDALMSVYAGGTCAGAPLISGEPADGGGQAAVSGLAVTQNGTTTFSVRFFDGAGNQSACASISFVEDSISPAVPVITGSAPGSPSNVNNPTISGTHTEAGVTVTLYNNAACTTPAGGMGSGVAGGSPIVWGISISVAANTNTNVYAKATDAAGNSSGCTATPLLYSEDSTAPALAVFTSTTPVSPSNATNNPVVNGTAEAGATVTLYTSGDCSGGSSGSGVATGGNFAITVSPLSNVTRIFKATVTDVAGNTSACSTSSITYVHDSSAPSAPTGLATTPASPSSNSSPTVSGFAEAGATVRIYSTANCTGAITATTTADAGGAWSRSIAVATNVTTSLSATAVDAAGNVSASCSSSVSYTHDSVASPPTFSSTNPPSPSASSTSPVINGNTENNATVRLYTNSMCADPVAGSTTANGSGMFSVVVSVSANTSTTFWGRQTDTANNTSACSPTSITYIHDNVGPTFAGATSAVVVDSDEILVSWATATDTFTPGASMRYDLCRSTTPDGCASFTVNATTAAGATSYNLTGLTSGQRYWIRVRAVDLAGNVSGSGSDVTAKTHGSGATKQIAAGMDHTCALLSDGTVQCWGEGGQGALGNGGTADSSIPVEVPGLTDVIQIAAGGGYNGSDSPLGGHTCALKSNGTIFCWGNGNYGQLGNGASSQQNSPVQVSGISNAIAIGAGMVSTCAVTTAGQVKCWGYSLAGNFGAGAPSNPNTPYTVAGLPVAPAALPVAVDLGSYHTCVLIADGTVRCMGWGTRGQLGNGVLADNSTPQVVSLGTNRARELDVGDFHACVVIQNGRARCWGDGSYGQLGNGGGTNSATPVEPASIAAPLAKITSIATGAYHTCAAVTDGGGTGGAAYCWGRGLNGQLGDGGITNDTRPVYVSGSVNVAQVTAGQAHSCALTAGGVVSCAGRQLSGRLGNGATADANVSTAVTAQGPYGVESAVSVRGFTYTTCSLLSNGRVKCWGYGPYGQIGNNTTNSPAYPYDDVELVSQAPLLKVVDVDSGGQHECAALVDGTVWCWGYNSDSQLGDGGTTARSYAQQVPGVTDAVAVAAGYYHSCALIVDGTVKCWGYNYYGQGGNGTAIPGATLLMATTVVGVSNAVEIDAGYYHTCARLVTGGVSCWGYNTYGQLGDTTTTSTGTPVTVAGSVTHAIKLAVAKYHTCAILSDSSAKCWGWGAYGQMGNGGSATTNATPGNVYSSGVVVMTDFVDLDGGYQHTCGIRVTGVPWCWGYNGGVGQGGQLGDNESTGTYNYYPAATYMLDSSTDIAGGFAYSCSAQSDGTAECWGDNGSGQLGNGLFSGTDSLVPAPVIFFP